jgi:hypothetical protein
VADELTQLRAAIDARRDALAAAADGLQDDVLARHHALDEGLARLRAPLDDPELLRAAPIPELSVELSPLAIAPAPPPPADSFAGEVDEDDDADDADDDDEFYVDDAADYDDDDEDDAEVDEVFAEDDAYTDDDDEDESRDAVAPGGLAWADSVRPSEQRRSIQSSEPDDALEQARWDQPQFGLNLPDDAPPDLPQPGRSPDHFSERLRRAVGDDDPLNDPVFEDKATKFFEEDEPAVRRRFGRRG